MRSRQATTTTDGWRADGRKFIGFSFFLWHGTYRQLVALVDWLLRRLEGLFCLFCMDQTERKVEPDNQPKQHDDATERVLMRLQNRLLELKEG